MPREEPVTIATLPLRGPTIRSQDAASPSQSIRFFAECQSIPGMTLGYNLVDGPYLVCGLMQKLTVD